MDTVSMSAAGIKKRKPGFDELKNKLMKDIDDGRLPPGAIIPSENDLSKLYDISRPSIRMVLKELEDENLIFRRPGKGRYVKDNTSHVGEQKAGAIRTIGVDVELLGNFEDWYASKLLRGIHSVCNENHARLSITGHAGLKKIKKGFIDGIVVTQASPQDYDMYGRMAQLEVYPALINRFTEHEDIAYFSVNYRIESEKATNLLLAKGHRKIGFVDTNIAVQSKQPRHLGFNDAISGHVLDAVPCPCEVPVMQSNDFYAAAIEEYLRHADITALYLTYGCFAIPLFTAVQRLGLEIPGDIEVICFDDIGYLSEFYNHPFNFVKMPLFEMGRDAADYLLRKIEGGKTYPVLKKMYKAELVIK